MTNGARVIDSTPPAMANSISPERIARAASPTALSPDAHSRLTVTPGMESGSPAKQQRHAGDIAVVLAGLVGAAEEHFVEPRPVGLVVAGDQRLDRHRGQVVGAHLGERAAVTADRGARGIADKDLSHRTLPQNRFAVQAIYGARRTGSNGPATTGIRHDQARVSRRIRPTCRRRCAPSGKARSRCSSWRVRKSAMRSTMRPCSASRHSSRRSRTASAPWCWPATATISAPASISPN